jgi:hypothetical protein
MLTFLILGIAVNWCHLPSWNLLVPGENAQHVHFPKFLYCFVPFYLLFYSFYILRRWLRMTQQMTSSTSSSISPEEARPTVTLGTTPEEEAWLAAILGTTKCRCLHVFTLDMWSCLWMFCMHAMNIVKFEWMCWILWSLNECVYGCVYCVCNVQVL